MILIPNSWGSVLEEVNHCHTKAPGHPCAVKGSTAPILQGVDSAKNAKALIATAQAFHTSVGSDSTTPETVKLTEAALRALPLVHGTTVAGVLGAFEDGLVSNAGMKDRREALQADIDELKDNIREGLGVKAVDFDHEMSPDPYDIASEFNIPRADAEQVSKDLTELAEVERIINGATYPADRKAGLDQFVFMTHGALHQDYGPIGVIVDNDAMEWATPKDIINVANTGEHVHDEFSPDVVRRYKETIVTREDYFKAAAADAGNVTALVNRGRERLWEVKASRVPKSKVLGVIVHDDLDLAIRLNDKLQQAGHYGKVLYVNEPTRGAHARWVYRQMKIIQRRGSWDHDLAKKLNDQGGAGETYVL